jgi:hypothetical protein
MNKSAKRAQIETILDQLDTNIAVDLRRIELCSFRINLLVHIIGPRGTPPSIKRSLALKEWDRVNKTIERISARVNTNRETASSLQMQCETVDSAAIMAIFTTCMAKLMPKHAVDDVHDNMAEAQQVVDNAQVVADDMAQPIALRNAPAVSEEELEATFYSMTMTPVPLPPQPIHTRAARPPGIAQFDTILRA